MLFMKIYNDKFCDIHNGIFLINIHNGIDLTEKEETIVLLVL